MSKKFDIVTIILMIILIIALFFVVFNYFTHSSSLTTNNSHLSMIDDVEEIQNLSGSNSVLKNNVIDISGDSQSTNPIIESVPSSDNQSGISGDGVIDTVYTEEEDSEKDTTTASPNIYDISNDDTPLIITSNDNISDKEKKEVLKELDETLMELLDVIDSVQIIDESRLETSESEVQQWESL